MATNSQTNRPEAQAIGFFRIDITSRDRLMATTVGRKEMLADLLEKLERNIGKRSGQHFIFIGPRGIGKTHFLAILDESVRKKEALLKHYTIIRFPEENNRILSFADFLLGIVEILGRETEDQEWQKFYHSLAENHSDSTIADTVLPRLKHYCKSTGRRLLILLENLSVLFTDQIKKEDQIHQFRSFLMDSPCAVLVGTSPVYFPGLYDHKSPLYDFFDIQILEDLSEEQTLDLIRSNLQWDQREDLLKDFDALKPKIRTLHTMTGGNPRLIMMLYELIARDNIMDVRIKFQKLLDQISPFYQDRLKDLAPQERALLETMALMRQEPRTPAAIARKLRKTPQQTSSLLKRMTQAGYLSISDNPVDKRSKLYRIKEGFFDIWLAMSESRVQRKYMIWLVDFFSRYYEEKQEREQKRLDLWQQLGKDAATYPSAENSEESLAYLSEVGDTYEKAQTKLELAVHQLKQGKTEPDRDFLKEIDALSLKQSAFVWMTDRAREWAGGGIEPDIQKWLEEMIQYWRFQRAGDLEKAIEIAHNLGTDLSGHGLHLVSTELIRDALQHTTAPEQCISLYNKMAHSQKMAGLLADSLGSLNQALEIAQRIEDKSRQGTTLNNIGQIYDARGDYETALKYLEQSLKISQEIGDKSGEGATLNNIGRIYHARGDYETALKYLEQSLKISQEIGDKSGQINGLHNLAIFTQDMGDSERFFEQESIAYQLALETGDAMGLYHVGKFLGQILYSAGKKKEGIEILKRSFEIGKQAGFPDVHEVEEILKGMGEM